SHLVGSAPPRLPGAREPTLSWNQLRSRFANQQGISYLHNLPRTEPRRPCPLKVESAQMASNVHDFTDEIQAGDFAALHHLCGKLIGVHASSGDFGFVVAVGAFWSDGPVVRTALEF